MRDPVCNHCRRVSEPGRLREAQIAILKHRLTPARRCQPTGSLLPPHAAHGSAADPQHRGSLGPAGTRTPRGTRRGSPSSVMSPVCGAPSAPRAAAAAAPAERGAGPPGTRAPRAAHPPRPPPTTAAPGPVRGPRREPRRREAVGKPGIPGRSRPHGDSGALAPPSPPPQPWEVSGM